MEVKRKPKSWKANDLLNRVQTSKMIVPGARVSINENEKKDWKWRKQRAQFKVRAKLEVRDKKEESEGGRNLVPSVRLSMWGGIQIEV